MAAILDLPLFYHQNEYGNRFPMSENIEKHVLFRLTPFLVKKMWTLKIFTPAVAAISDFTISRHW